MLKIFRTLWSTANEWPAKSEFEPVRGWSPQVVDDTWNGGAENDIYGKLFFHLRWLISSSLSRLSTMKNTIRILNMPPFGLPSHLNGTTFDRVDVSGPTDVCLSPSPVLISFIRFLCVNPLYYHTHGARSAFQFSI